MKKILLTICLLLSIAVNAQAADRLFKTVCPAGANTCQDGSTGDYATLDDCMDSNEKDLTDSDEYFDVEISGDWSGGADTSTVTIANYTTDATRYINIYVHSGAIHDGKYNTNKYRIETEQDGGAAFNIYSSFVTLTGVQVKNTSTNDSHWTRAITINANNVTVDKTIGYSFGRGFVNSVDNADITLSNSTFISTSTDSGDWYHAIYIGGDYGEPTSNNVYNSIGVSYSSGCGICADAYAVTVKNSYAYSVAQTDYQDYVNLTTCAAADTSGDPAGLDSVAYSTSSGAYFTNVTQGSEDFHIGASSTLKDAGTSLAGIVDDDIDGDTRSGTWDVGVDEIVSSEIKNRFIIMQ